MWSKCDERIIRTYISKMEAPRLGLSKERFEMESYSQWAVLEAVTYLKGRRDTIQALEEFIHKMYEYSCVNSKTSCIFSTAKTAVEDLLDALISGK